MEQSDVKTSKGAICMGAIGVEMGSSQERRIYDFSKSDGFQRPYTAFHTDVEPQRIWV
jgi:hypothetical protein